MKSTLVTFGFLFLVSLSFGKIEGGIETPETWTFKDIQLSSGIKLTYALILPENYDSKKKHTVLLALPPGGQGKYMVEYGLKNHWAKEALKRGWIVISPVSPSGGFSNGTVMNEFCEHLIKSLSVEGNQFHLAGISNGGMSVFRVAPKIGTYLKSITVLAGYTRKQDDLKKIKHLPIVLFVGEKDYSWSRPMKKMKLELDEIGAKVTWKEIKNEGHEIHSLFNSPVVFDLMKSSSN